MRELIVDKSWTYREAVYHLKALRLQYEEVLASFSIWQIKEKRDFIVETRDKFYALDILEWQKDRMWNYMNRNDFLYSIIQSAIRYK